MRPSETDRADIEAGRRSPVSTEQMSAPETGSRLTKGLTRNVVVLGAVSLCTDISSEMLAPVRFLFLVYTLGTPLVIAGLIEGVAESVSSLLKIWSGRLADRVSDRKLLIAGGYALSNGTKPLLAFVLSWQPALGLIVLDRVGKAVRGSPRDAVIADSTPREYRGKAFGFHRGMDTLGAAIGPLLTVLILRFSGVDLRPVFAWTVIPGALAVVLALLLVRDRRAASRARKPADSRATPSGARLGRAFWAITCIATLFALGNSSDAFIFLRTQGLEQSLEAVPLVYFAYNMVYALLATPLGGLSDHFGRAPVLLGGFIAFALVYAGWAAASSGWNVWVLFLVYGVYAAAVEGAGKALVTDLIFPSQRGTALGRYNGMVGLAALPANVIAGWLWNQYGPSAPFVFGSAVGLTAAAALGGMMLFAPRLLSVRWRETGGEPS